MLDNLKRDAGAYAEYGSWYKKLGFWVVATYRYGAWADGLPAVARFLMMLPYRVASVAVRLVLHVHVHEKAKIGPGLCLFHPFNVFVPPTEIGENCMIAHEVTIGRNHRRPGYPTIGNNVKLHAGARVLGDIHLGDEVRIGSNCVVTSSVKAGGIVATAPNRVVYR